MKEVDMSLIQTLQIKMSKVNLANREFSNICGSLYKLYRQPNQISYKASENLTIYICERIEQVPVGEWEDFKSKRMDVLEQMHQDICKYQGEIPEEMKAMVNVMMQVEYEKTAM